MQTFDGQRPGDHDGRPVQSAREFTTQIGDLSAQVGGGVEPAGIAVGIADPPRPEGACAQDRVQADRRCVSTDDQDIGSRALAQSVHDAAVGVDDVIRNGCQGDVVDRLRCHHQHVIGVRDHQQVGQASGVATTRLAETEGCTRPRLVGFACGVMSFETGPARATRHLEGN